MSDVAETVHQDPIQDIRISVLYDNNPYRDGLETAWGFACLIEGAEKTILFDTGGDGAVLLANMAELGIKPEDIDLVVLSHQHWDHIGGIYHVLNVNPHVQIYLPHSFSAHFKQDLQRYGTTLVEVKTAQQICPNVSSTGDLEGQIREQALLVQTQKGMIVITGCAHPGIVKIIQHTKTVVPKEVLLTMGGFHLMNDHETAIMKVVAQFRALDVQYIAASHCTGELARQVFAQEYQQHCIPIGVGHVITLKELS